MFCCCYTYSWRSTSVCVCGCECVFAGDRGGRRPVATGRGWILQMILCVAATATQLELLSPLILGLHVMWKTPRADSTSSSDDRAFTCQLVFIIPSRFVVYSTKFNLSYVKYFPITVVFFFFFKDEYRDCILFCSFWIKPATNRRISWHHVSFFFFFFLVAVFCF